MPKGHAQSEARAWLAAVVESSDDAIVSKTLNSIVTTWNRGAERIFGYTAEEMIGRPITIIIPDERADEEPMIIRRLSRGERVDHFETVRRRKNGDLVEVSVTISPVLDAHGRIVGVSKIARDITIQKRFERELHDAREAAEAANRAKDHFLSVLSHELRTPLTPALAAISLLERTGDVPSVIREQLSMVRRSIETQARLVDDLLDVTRIARGKISLNFEVLDTHTVIRAALLMFQREIDDKALEVTTALSAKQHHVLADSGRFQQMLLNLMSNAIKFTPAGGKIAIRTTEEGETLRIDVRDTGVGIEASVMPRLFAAFEQGETTVTRRFGGLGLGLSIVKSLAKMHNGSIEAQSEGANKGATFVLRLPRANAPDVGASIIHEATHATSARVLLVEDHDDTRNIMEILLSAIGCKVRAVKSVGEAASIAGETSFDVMICDFGLPDGTGADALTAVLKKQTVKAIAMTGFGQEEDIRRTREAGFALHLTKPVSFDVLRQSLERILRAG